MEADIALKSAKQFIAVGDKKQAIFGFQGGSIINFKHFENSKKFILSENYRSTDQILKFASEHFVSKTRESSHREELKGLKSAEGKKGERPVIYEVDKDSISVAVKTLVQNLMGTTDNLAVIARTNSQIMDIGRELKSSGIDFSTTFFTASTEAKANIIKFLKGVLSNNIIDMKNAMFTPFFPISLQEAFEVSEIKEKDLTKDLFYQRCPEFQKLRGSIRNVEDVNTLFNEKIIPISLTYGEEYLSAALKLEEAYQEALNVIEPKTINNLTVFLDTADLLTVELERENKVILTTVHKAKGKEFDTVIYVPTKTMDRSSFQDEVVEAILKCNGMNVEEELEEESLRINFVAFTRAMNRLYIITDKTLDFLNEHAVSDVLLAPSGEESEFTESRKKAYAYFLNGELDKAKELLNSKKKWMLDYVKRYFESLSSISFSALPDSAYDYFVKTILRVREYSTALTTGSDVHVIAEKIVSGIECDVPEELMPFRKNIELLLSKISAEYPDLFGTEYGFKVPLSEIIETDEKLLFTGYIDAIFKNNDNYLIVDWKTDRDKGSGSKYRQQLEAYKRAFCSARKISPDKVKIAIGFVGLRGVVYTGKVGALLDDKQPQRTAFDTFSKKVNTILEWKKELNLFFDKLIDENKVDDVLWRSIVETYRAETM
jgi:DNA helicase-2/ATP-dependent DNA helicase PcrA